MIVQNGPVGMTTTNLLTLGAGAAPGGSMALDLLLILACAGLVALVFGRLRIAVIPGYLVAGALIGPHAIGLVDDANEIEGIASLATVLLMFGIGMHLDASVLRRGAGSILTIGVLTTIATGSLIAAGAKAAGVSAGESIVIGMAMSLSSTAVVLRVLQQRRELFTAAGRVSLGVLLVQDLMVIAMLAAVPLLNQASGEMPDVTRVDPDGAMIALGDAAISVAGVVGVVLIGKLVLPRIMVEAAKSSSSEVMLVIAAAAALGAAVVTALCGLSAELGAFLAGFLLAGTPFRYQLAGQISPLRDLFMAVFFTTVGLRVDLPEMANAWWIVGLGTLGVMALKGVVISSIAWATGASPMIAARAGAWLAQGGEFSLVLLSVAAAAGVLAPETESLTIGVIVCTLLLTPAVIGRAALAARLVSGLPMAPWGGTSLRETPALRDADDPDEDHPVVPRVLIAGFGPIGRACAERLERAGVPVAIIELNARTVRTQLELGRAAYYGDVTNRDVLEHAGIFDAIGVLLTMPDEEAMLRSVRTIRSLRPDVLIAARAGVVSKSMQARELGADEVIVEELAGAELMAQRVLERLEERERG